VVILGYQSLPSFIGHPIFSGQPLVKDRLHGYGIETNCSGGLLSLQSRHMKTYQWAILLATVYLLVYVVLFNTGASLRLLSAMFVLSPLPVLIMVYQVLRNGHYHGRTLEEGEEFGYADKSKEELWIV
jgi:hypothetical protein